MKEKGIEDVLLTGGGIIPEVDINLLKKQGVGELFTPVPPPSTLPTSSKPGSPPTPATNLVLENRST